MWFRDLLVSIRNVVKLIDKSFSFVVVICDYNMQSAISTSCDDSCDNYDDLTTTSLTTIKGTGHSDITAIPTTLNAHMAELLANVGFHVAKNKTINASLAEYIERRGPRPAQMYLSSSRSGRISGMSASDIKATKELIDNFNLPYFVHGPLIFNLARPATKKEPNNPEWGLNIVRSQLVDTHKSGGRGVVVHVGKYLDMGKDQALQNMEKYTREIIPAATAQCPLLLETPAGQGTELCTSFEEFSAFYNQFSDKDKTRFKICVDTAHVHGAGYDPLAYLQGIVEHHGPESLALIHLNDSKVVCGAMKDRHAFVGTGHIGLEKMTQVIRWADANGYPMVIE